MQRLTMLFPFWVDMAVPVFMIISGYLYSLSYQKSGYSNLKQCYSIKASIKRLIRFTIPFFIIFLIEHIIFRFLFNQPSNVANVIKSFITGGTGPGSYYYPLLIQFVFIMPLIFFVIKKYDIKGLLVCVAANFLFEVIKSNLYISEGVYRLLVFRYITVIAFGCYFAIAKTKLGIGIGCTMMIIGIVYIIVTQYLAFPPVIMKYWTGTSMLASIYIIPIASMLLKCEKLRFSPIELIGKASYNIFLVQMAYYGIFADWLYAVIENKFLQFVISLLICVLLGVVFYLVETPLTKRILKILKLSS